MKEKLALLGGPKTVTLPSPPYPVIGHEEVSAVVKVLMSRQVSDCGRGEFVAEMEDDYAAHFSTKYALSFSSGTAAIASALFAVGVRPGTEVLTTGNTWISAITAIAHAGGTPVFCDVRPNTVHIDPREIRRKAGPHTKAVIVTHLWGIPVNMDPILKVARKLGLAVIEDCSHAHGARYKGRLVGTLGEIGCFSLQGSKAIVAGEGGFMLTNSKLYYERAIVPGHHGRRLTMLTLKQVKPFAAASGQWTYRISPVAAAIATEQLKRLDALNAARQANFDRMARRLRKTAAFIKWHSLPPRSQRGWYGTPAFYQHKGRLSRDLFVQACRAEGLALVPGGYSDWPKAPLFQDVRLYSQMWVVEHANGVAFKPVPPGGLPNNDRMREKLMLFPIPAVESPALMDQMASAVEKVAANMAVLARYRPRARK
jgi:perosamine synthetase